MILKNIECQNNKFIDVVIDELIKNNINYTLIKNENFTEVHFDNYIYRFFYLELAQKQDEPLSFINSVGISLKQYKKEKKVQSGYRKYNKGLIRNDNKKNKIGRR